MSTLRLELASDAQLTTVWREIMAGRVGGRPAHARDVTPYHPDNYFNLQLP